MLGRRGGSLLAVAGFCRLQTLVGCDGATRAHRIRAGFDDRPVVVFDRQGAKLARAC